MSVLIHPIVSQSVQRTAELETATGLRARIQGRIHALFKADGTAPQMRASENPKLVLINAYPHGEQS